MKLVLVVTVLAIILASTMGTNSNKSGKKTLGCRGDLNATAGCDKTCQRRCPGPKPDPCVCPNKNSCMCRKQYVFDPTIWKCVRLKDCAPPPTEEDTTTTESITTTDKPTTEIETTTEVDKTTTDGDTTTNESTTEVETTTKGNNTTTESITTTDKPTTEIETTTEVDTTTADYNTTTKKPTTEIETTTEVDKTTTDYDATTNESTTEIETTTKGNNTTTESITTTDKSTTEIETTTEVDTTTADYNTTTKKPTTEIETTTEVDKTTTDYDTTTNESTTEIETTTEGNNTTTDYDTTTNESTTEIETTTEGNNTTTDYDTTTNESTTEIETTTEGNNTTTEYDTTTNESTKEVETTTEGNNTTTDCDTTTNESTTEVETTTEGNNTTTDCDTTTNESTTEVETTPKGDKTTTETTTDCDDYDDTTAAQPTTTTDSNDSGDVPCQCSCDCSGNEITTQEPTTTPECEDKATEDPTTGYDDETTNGCDDEITYGCDDETTNGCDDETTNGCDDETTTGCDDETTTESDGVTTTECDDTTTTEGEDETTEVTTTEAIPTLEECPEALDRFKKNLYALSLKFLYMYTLTFPGQTYAGSPLGTSFALMFFQYFAKRVLYSELTRATALNTPSEIVCVCNKINEVIYSDMSAGLAGGLAIAVNSNYTFTSQAERIMKEVIVGKLVPKISYSAMNGAISYLTNNTINNVINNTNEFDQMVSLSGSLINITIHSNKSVIKPFYKAPFKYSPANYTQVKGMYDYAECHIIRAKILRINSIEGNLSIIIVLPHAAFELNKFLKTITAENLLKCFKSMKLSLVNVEIPQINSNSTINTLKEIKYANITNLISSTAKYDNMLVGETQITLTKARQRTVIQVRSGVPLPPSIHDIHKIFAPQSFFIANTPHIYFVVLQSLGDMPVASGITASYAYGSQTLGSDE